MAIQIEEVSNRNPHLRVSNRLTVKEQSELTDDYSLTWEWVGEMVK